MSSLENKRCDVCQGPFNENDDVIWIDDEHAYHKTCARDRYHNMQKTDYHGLHKNLARDNALHQDAAAANMECSTDENGLSLDDNLATVVYGQICYPPYVESHPGINDRKDGSVIQKDAAGEPTLNQDEKSNKHVESEAMDTEPEASIMTTEKKNFKCHKCSMPQDDSLARCSCCGAPRLTFSLTNSSVQNTVDINGDKCKQIASSTINDEGDDPYKSSRPTDRMYPILDISPPTTLGSTSGKISNESEQRHRVKETSQSQIRSSSEYEAVVYIPDLPAEIEDNNQLEHTIRQRLSTVYNIETGDVKCYSNLGIGLFHVRNNEIKKHLVNVVGKMSWDSGEDSTMISFRDAITFESYIVFERKKEDKPIDFPKPDQIVPRWIHTYNGERPLVCEQLNIQYPNIYRIVSQSLQELLRVTSTLDLVIKSRKARVYPCAYCSYFEDLPISTTENQLRDLICNAVGLRKTSLSSSSLYIQLNTSTNNACILATDRARKWADKDSIYIGSEFIAKRKNLGYCLLLHPVRQKDEVDAIIRHEIFAGKAKMIHHFGQNLILKIYEKNMYEKCENSNTLRIGKGIIVNMEIYTGTPDPNKKEIDVDTWYDEEMLQCESNIMPFIQQPEHKIFHLQWNAQIWLKQYERTRKLQRQSSIVSNDKQQESISNNEMLHRLRVTVMLNTLAVIRKRSYIVDDHEVQLHLNPKLKTIVYDHQSKLLSSGPIPIKETPFKRTEVKVMKEDCLVVYENLVKEQKRPLLLNMASATSPGGGFRKGDGAQEENLFRRSDYFRSLDIGLDEYINDSSQRLYCTSKATSNLLPDPRTMYPMDEYGAIYTSGLTVFRQPEMNGYEFMEKPLKDVCSLAMAAYRHPLLNDNMLSPKFAVGMRKKIENIFAIAYHNQHDSLILSALGCGAFRNPPDHVAKIFRSVIEQYAGFFQFIIFAIIDDHNAGLNLNPEGNFLPFQREFEQSIFDRIQPINRANTIFGPYRFISDGLIVDDVSIFQSTPCKYGGKCRDIFDSVHTNKYFHPPSCTEVCVTGKCTKKDDIVHTDSFIHRYICPHGGQCQDINDAKHDREYEHPSYCSNGGSCQDTSDNHERDYRHLPLCTEAHKCDEYRRHVRHHCDAYRHCKPSCQYGRYCANFHDKEHMENYQHPFPPACPWTPYHCTLYDEFTQSSNTERLPHHVQQHCVDFAHVCQFGNNCVEQNPSHWKRTIHVPRTVCLAGKGCSKLNQEEHLNLFTHSNVQDIRYLCKNGSTCRDYDNTLHQALYRHRLTDDTSTVIQCFDLNDNINFFENHRQNIRRILGHIKCNNWETFKSGSVPENILNWIRTIQPIYQCRSDVFELILLQERVMSEQQMEYFKDPKYIAHCVLQNNRIKSIHNLKNDQCKECARNYITALITDQQYSIQQEKDLLSKYISQDDIELIQKIATEMAQASKKLSIHRFDDKLKPNKHILSVLGPYFNSKCDDINIVFKQEVLHHPDANFSILPSSFYRTGKYYQYQPWLETSSYSKDELIKQVHQTKLHASMPNYEQTAATELIACASYSMKKHTMNIDLDTILGRWFNADLEIAIEARLPPLISLDYVEQIYMTQNTFDSFNIDIHRKIKTIFGDRLMISSSRSNEEYHHYVKHNIKSIPRPIQGFVITIPSTKFMDNLVLPIKLSQEYEYYRTKSSADISIYIYWQIINGDMMLTLSNEQIHSNESQSKMRCLLCYIAEKPIRNNNNQYNENPSYLHLGQPFQHQAFVSQNYYAGKSTSLYLGCNLDDVITFCLEIKPSNGNVKLSHVGSNSIYNHEIISYTFDKSDIDLSKLEFVHISAGNRAVSIRNFFVTFEKQNDLHPKIETKVDKSPSSEKASTNDVQANKSPGRSSASFFAGSVDQVKNKALKLVDQTLDRFGGKKNSQYKPCSQGINCLTQFSDNGSHHNSKYSHPCRFAELCRNHEPHLTHEPREVNACRYEPNCKSLSDPLHRAKFRHSGLPYFLIPCREQSRCKDNSEKHRSRYSHGEQVLETNGK